jgi:hypothetical protein
VVSQATLSWPMRPGVANVQALEWMEPGHWPCFQLGSQSPKEPPVAPRTGATGVKQSQTFSEDLAVVPLRLAGSRARCLLLASSHPGRWVSEHLARPRITTQVHHTEKAPNCVSSSFAFVNPSLSKSKSEGMTSHPDLCKDLQPVTKTGTCPGAAHSGVGVHQLFTRNPASLLYACPAWLLLSGHRQQKPAPLTL